MTYNNIILVDSSYTSFYRFFATKAWYGLAYKEEMKEIKEEGSDTYDWLSNEVFMEKYEKMYLESINKLVGKKVFNDSMIIFARDPPQNTIWRNDDIDGYKQGRQDLTKTNNFKPIFKHTYETLIPRWVKNNDHIHEIKQDKIEADDIIAITTMFLKKKKHKFEKIIVVSGDEDFLQLGNDNIYFAQYRKKKMFQLTEEEAQYKLHEKIVKGDSSDNIPSIFKNKRIPKVTKELFLNNKKELLEYLESNKEIQEKYKRNEKIIDFNFIPKKYITKLEQKLKKIF
jgi:5'-3' exonuclease